MLKEKISKDLQYLYSIKVEMYFSILLFVLACATGYLFAKNHPAETAEYLKDIVEFFESLDHATPFQTFLSIFENNATVMLTIVCSGVFAGLSSVFFLATNGFMFGLVSQVILQKESLILLAFGILPHGIVEIPCMIFAAAIGLHLGVVLVRKISGKTVNLTEETARGLEFAATVIIPLLFIAALIEAYITPLFMALADSIL